MRGRFMRKLLFGVLLTTLAILVTLATPVRAAAVDPDTVGSWEFPMPVGRWLWKINANGTYEFHSEAADGVAPHAGTFTASGGVWSLQASNGYSDHGTYVIQPPGTFVATGQLGTAAWHHPASTANDPSVIGAWVLPVNGAQWVWLIDYDGTYQFHSEPENGTAPHAGAFAAGSGYWWLSASNGYADGGTYIVQEPDTLIATGRLGTATWHHPPRDPTDKSDDLDHDPCFIKAMKAGLATGREQQCP